VSSSWAGTRTALYFGRNGVGPFCYGNGTDDISLNFTIGPDGIPLVLTTPTTLEKASMPIPTNYQIWAYDLNDFAAVKAGTKQPWEVVPYDVWPLNLPTPAPSVLLGGVGYDPVSQSIYVSQYKGDPDGYGNRPVIHVLRVNISGASFTTPSTVSSVAITTDKAAPQPPNTAVTFTAAPAGGVAPYQYKWSISDGAVSSGRFRMVDDESNELDANDCKPQLPGDSVGAKWLQHRQQPGGTSEHRLSNRRDSDSCQYRHCRVAHCRPRSAAAGVYCD
jgi:hypothetical protein